jgi:hypothetical protein
MNGVLQVVILAAQGIHLVLGVFGVAIYRIYKGGGLFSSILLCWGLCIFWAVIWCFVLPVVLLPFGKEIFLLFPEVIGVPVLVFAGWLPCMFVCAIAHGFIATVRREKKPRAL